MVLPITVTVGFGHNDIEHISIDIRPAQYRHLRELLPLIIPYTVNCRAIFREQHHRLQLLIRQCKVVHRTVRFGLVMEALCVRLVCRIAIETSFRRPVQKDLDTLHRLKGVTAGQTFADKVQLEFYQYLVSNIPKYIFGRNSQIWRSIVLCLVNVPLSIARPSFFQFPFSFVNQQPIYFDNG